VSPGCQAGAAKDQFKQCRVKAAGDGYLPGSIGVGDADKDRWREAGILRPLQKPGKIQL